MKSVVITCLLVAGLAGTAAAQKLDQFAELPGRNEPSAETLALVTRAMSNKLHLNEAQYIRLRAANKIRLTRLDEIQWQCRDDVARRQTQIVELQAQYEAECRRILSPSQLSLLREEQQQKPDVLPKTDSNVGGIG